MFVPPITAILSVILQFQYGQYDHARPACFSKNAAFFPATILLRSTICKYYPYILTLPNLPIIFNTKHDNTEKFYYIITFANLPNFPLFFLPSVWYSLIERFIILSIISYYIIS